MLNSNYLRKLDMQDLMIFVTLYERNSVTDTSEALFVSQSTVSYCLKKLRIGFGDELFINTRIGMRPTLKASTMYSHVLQILDKINLCHSGLDLLAPNQLPTTFNICAPEYFELLLLPTLLKNFNQCGREVVVNVIKFGKKIPTEELNDGSLDLAFCFGPNYHHIHTSLKSRTLTEDDLVCVMDKDSSSTVQSMDIDMFTSRQHIFPTPWTSETNMVDGWLEQQGYRRQIIAKANTYLAALNMVHGTDFILTLPRRIQALLWNDQKLAFYDMPKGFKRFTLEMLWSELADRDDASLWFRNQIITACHVQKFLPVPTLGKG
ncbi:MULTISPECIES: LysR family transcriptional regulator [unclassified Pseudomonas]|uniref:LysR family transcriptional regulator n=1 Tax=unclassified Pseudomonas TaxID=196821 RepID=UPI002B232088|nr:MULTISPECIES: LysR family transcriptional regulator [unclassified Pseudomonas]MEA9979791.1 LysR family transcriptional regulator [Pseudomonas sp. RTS4]MEB0200105.1 LysR family transcriptional regulator [Pseudomonas sp. 5S4]MEB0248424.1 LysR family transcriptional regulator [Pseudomonas sp. 10S5]